MTTAKSPASKRAEDASSTPRQRQIETLFGQFCLACGALGPLVWGGMIVWAAAQNEGYSHRIDMISALATGESDSAVLMRALGFGLSGALYVVAGLYAAFRLRHDPASVLASLLLVAGGIGRIGGGIYPCDASCLGFEVPEAARMHLWTMAINDVSLIFAALAFGVTVNRYPQLKWFSSLSFGCGSWTIVSMVMMVTSAGEQGLYQRYATGILSVWMVIWAVMMWRSRIWAEDLEWRKPDYAPRHRHFRRK